MSQNTTTDLIASLKDDLSKIQQANAGKKSEILFSSATPQLTALLTSLDSPDQENLTTEQITALVGYLLQYLLYDETSSIALATILELSQPTAAGSDVRHMLQDQLEDLISTAESRIEVQNLFTIFTELFPIQIELCTSFFLQNDEFLKIIATEITHLLNLKTNEIGYNVDRIDVLLSLFSTACIEETCRAVIVDQYIPLLIKLLNLDGSNHGHLRIECLVSAILVKAWNNIKKESFEKFKGLLSLDNLTEIMINGVIGFNKSRDSHKLLSDSIEGLAFLSLNVRIKKILRDDDNFMRALINESSLKDTKVTYGILCIITNLTTYNKILSKEQESVQSLKDHANLSNVNTQTGERTKPQKDNDDEITAFIITLLDDYQLLSKLANTIQELPPSKGILAQSIRNLYNFSDQPKLRARVVKQGGLNFVLTYLANRSQGISYTLEHGIKVDTVVDDVETRYLAIKTLARILINNDPNLLFKKFDSVTPVPFLLEIIVQYDIEVHGTKYTTETPLTGLGDNGIESIDCFEALVALINLASVDNETIKNLIVKLGWTALDNLMLSSNVQIQRYVLELISNLIFSPICSEKFFNWSNVKDDNYRNYKKLVQLMNLNDLQSQLAILNIFANCSEFEMITSILVQSDIFVENLIGLLKGQNDNDEVMLRTCYTLSNLSHLEEKGLLVAKTDVLKPLLIGIIKAAGDNEVKELALDALKSL